MKVAFSIGIMPMEFWAMTPWQFRCCVEAFERRREREWDEKVWFMFHDAILPKLKKLPKMADYMAAAIRRKKEVKGIDEVSIKARLKAYQKQKDLTS